MSGIRDRFSPSPSSHARVALAFSVIVPVPRFLARWYSGLRVIRIRRPPIVASSVTAGTDPAGAWSDSRRLPSLRAPGTVP